MEPGAWFGAAIPTLLPIALPSLSLEVEAADIKM